MLDLDHSSPYGMFILKADIYIPMHMRIPVALNVYLSYKRNRSSLIWVEQQITLYPHRDENNLWRITNGSAPYGPATIPWDDLPFENVLTGSRIRLEHKITNKRLHSHDVRPPVSDVEFQNEVSGYGFEGYVELGRIWEARLITPDSGEMQMTISSWRSPERREVENGIVRRNIVYGPCAASLGCDMP